MAGANGGAAIDRTALGTGWARAKEDLIQGRTFVRHPVQVELVELDRPAWLDSLAKSLTAGTYTPGPMEICEVPKAGGGIRPGSILRLEDATVFAACVDAAYEAIFDYVASTGADADFNYRLRAPDKRDSGWFLNKFQGWRLFDQVSLAKLSAGCQYVVVTDVAGFYEHIDHSTLMSDLRSCGVPQPVIELLSRLLSSWAQVPHRGIPQNQSPSDLLAKLYLSPVDHQLRELGYDHVRYVDDIRVFCADLSTARRSILDLSRILRSRGLSLQSAKLEVLRSDIARVRFDGVRPIIEGVVRSYVDRLTEIAGVDEGYLTITEAENALDAASSEAPPVEVLRRVFDAYFGEDSSDFPKTLFRFILRRLGRAGDDHAVSRMVHFIRSHPEETEAAVRYLVRCGRLSTVAADLTAYLTSPEAVYPYQTYVVAVAATSSDEPPSPVLSRHLMSVAFDNSAPAYARAACRAFLGRHGRQPDLERLEQSFAAEQSPLGQAEIICGLNNMERGRRNAFYTKVRGLGEYQRRACDWSKRSVPG